MIDLGRRMEMILNGAGIAEANRARTEAAEARAAAEAKTANSVAPIALQAEAAPVAETVALQPDPAAERQSLLRLAYIAGLGVLTGPQFASVEARLAAAQIEVPNGAGYGLGLAV